VIVLSELTLTDWIPALDRLSKKMPWNDRLRVGRLTVSFRSIDAMLNVMEVFGTALNLSVRALMAARRQWRRSPGRRHRQQSLASASS
jgi:hypothetical protein